MASSSMCKAVTPVTASRAIQTKAAAVHSCAKRQKPAKNEIQKIREIDGSYLFLQRQIFGMKHAMNGNGSYLNMLDFGWKNS